MSKTREILERVRENELEVAEADELLRHEYFNRLRHATFRVCLIEKWIAENLNHPYFGLEFSEATYRVFESMHLSRDSDGNWRNDCESYCDPAKSDNLAMNGNGQIRAVARCWGSLKGSNMMALLSLDRTSDVMVAVKLTLSE